MKNNVICTHPDRQREARGEVGIWICELNGGCHESTSIWGRPCPYNRADQAPAPLSDSADCPT